jgi:hypothetical protein
MKVEDDPLRKLVLQCGSPPHRHHAAGKDPAAKPLKQLLAVMLVFTVAIVLTLGRGMAPRCAVA